MYDPVETEMSYQYLLRLVERFGSGITIIGGWAAHFLVNANYRKATGRDYLRSRDIDMIISTRPSFIKLFEAGLDELGFMPGGFPFRYHLFLDRETKKPLEDRIARTRPVPDLIYIDLDLFSQKKVKLGTWVIKDLGKILKEKIIVDRIPVTRPEHLFDLKARSFKERENLEKKEKDACDIFALLFYSGMAPEKRKIKDTVSSLVEDFCGPIAEQLFMDRGVEGLIRRRLEGLLV